MIIKVENYKNEYDILSFTADVNQKDILLNEGKRVAFFENEKLYIYPTGTEIQLMEDEISDFSCLGNGSILEMSAGSAFVCFDIDSPDNAIFITNQCNSSCIMCPVSEISRKTSSIERIENLLKICKHIPNYEHHITITGGEPFLLKEEIFELFNYLKCNLNRIDYLLLTNGRALSNEKYFDRFMETIPSKIIVGIPVHGCDAETHDKITRAPGSFDQTVKGIKRLLGTNVRIELRIVVSKLNLEYIDKIVDFVIAEFKGVFTIKFIGLEMLGAARKHMDSVWIDYKASFKEMKMPMKRLILNGFDVGIYNYPLCCVDRGYWPICEKSISEYKIRYLAECEKCSQKDACGGMFQGTYRLMEGIVKAIE